jgi:hypothetical protein
MPRYKCKNIAALDIALIGLPAKMRVEADSGTGVSAKTVGELRKVTTWSENLVITTPAPICRKCYDGPVALRMHNCIASQTSLRASRLLSSARTQPAQVLDSRLWNSEKSEPDRCRPAPKAKPRRGATPSTGFCARGNRRRTVPSHEEGISLPSKRIAVCSIPDSGALPGSERSEKAPLCWRGQGGSSC